MVESLIENVHRANLKPMEQAKAILEVFKAGETILPGEIIADRLPASHPEAVYALRLDLNCAAIRKIKHACDR